jgi:hypothetical protein
MKLLLDECVDWRLLRELADFDVKTVRQMGWAGIENGALLRAAEGEFDAFVTVDKNLSFQQNLSGFAIFVVVLRSGSLRLTDLTEACAQAEGCSPRSHAWQGSNHRGMKSSAQVGRSAEVAGEARSASARAVLW